MDAVNNVSYNWKGGLSPYSGGSAKVSWVHNYMKQGYNSNTYAFEVAYANPLDIPDLIFVFGNIGSTRLSQQAPQWNVGVDWHNELLNESYRRMTAWDSPAVTATQMSYDYALEVLKEVGATKPFRDSVDQRVVADFAAGTGAIIDNVVFPDDFPVFSNPAPPADRDNDGMADTWEQAQGLNTALSDSALDQDGDGYTNVEAYFHYLSGVTQSVQPDDTMDESTGDSSSGDGRGGGAGCFIETVLGILG